MRPRILSFIRPYRPGNSPAMSATHSRYRLLWLGLGLVLITLGLYSRVLHHDFVQFDDQDYVTDNPHVRAGLTPGGVAWAFTQVKSANWHPLTWLSHMLDCEVFSLRAGGHHFTSVVLHSVNAVSLMLVLWQLTGAIWRAALVAAWFAWHPLHVESVAWVAERKDVLSTLFGLLSLWFYTGHAKSNSGPAPKKGLHLACALVCFALSLASKPMLVTLPFLFLLLDVWPLGRIPLSSASGAWAALRLRVVEKLPFFVLTLGSSVFTFWIQREAGAMGFAGELALTQRAANGLVAYVRYLGKAFWPHTLAAPYPHPGQWPMATVALAAVLLFGATALVLLRLRRQPYLAVGWFWYLGTLVPVLGLVQVGAQSMADRYTYVPLIGLAVTLSWWLADWTRNKRGLRLATSTLALMATTALVARTWMQIPVWRDTESLFTHAIKETRGNWIAHYNLALLAMRRYQETQRTTLTAQVTPSAPRASAARDYLGEVIEHCRATIAHRAQFADPYMTLAKALTERGQLDDARAQLGQAIRLNPNLPEARQNLAEIFHRQGRAREAIPEYETALRLKPDWEPVLNNFAWLLATHPDEAVRDGAAAVRLARRACELTGYTNLWYLHTLAAAEAESGAFSDAVQTATAAHRLAFATGQNSLSDIAAARVALYASRRPFRDPPPAP